MDPLPLYRSFVDIKKILLVKLKHIGDVLLMTPCIRALHEAFPSAKISVAVNEGTESMLINHPLLEEVIIFPRPSLKNNFAQRISKEISFISQLRQRHFDMVIDLTSADRAAWIAKLSGARYRLAYDPLGKGFLGKRFLYNFLAPYPQDQDLHEVQKNLGVLKFIGIHHSSALELYFSEQDQRIANQALSHFGLSATDSYVVIHPTSRWLFKCWSNDRFAALIDWIQLTHHLPVIVTCGPDQRELECVHKTLAYCKTKPHQLLGQLELTQWAALVKKARLFIGVDSAPTHIAASQKTPSAVFFGPTGFQNWRPWAVEHIVLVHDCPCSRDRKPHCDWSQTRACIEAITLEEGKKAVNQLLSLNK